MTKETKFKRLFYDIEVSPNLVFSWGVGRKISIDYNSIVNERAIICICYKWEHETKVHSLQWDKGNDKKLVQEFAKIISKADEVVGHNSAQFDTRWFRTRCLIHNVSVPHDIKNVDTLRLSRSGFRFNSNRLDYISKYLGVGGKTDTNFGLWKDIVLKNDKKALTTMVNYCKNDVVILEKVYKKLNPYVASATHRAVLEGKNTCHCPECSSARTISNGTRISATGGIKRRLHCMNCGKYFSIAESVYIKLNS